MIQRAFRSGHIDIDCVDSFGRGAINLAIEAENLEMLEMLVVMGVGPKDNLLHAINAEFVEAVELLLQYEELVHTEGDPYVSRERSTNSFTRSSACLPRLGGGGGLEERFLPWGYFKTKIRIRYSI